MNVMHVGASGTIHNYQKYRRELTQRRFRVKISPIKCPATVNYLLN
jgi:hypothetical protein